MQRTCTCCGKEKPLEEYRLNLRTGRYSFRCVACGVGTERKNRYVRRSMENYLRRKISLAKSSKRQVAVEMTIEDVMAVYEGQGGCCAVTGVALTHEGESYSDASIDRIDPNDSYHPANIRIVCVGVNIMRQRMSDDDFGHWCLLVVKGMGLWK